jgi:hypothetical protein
MCSQKDGLALGCSQKAEPGGAGRSGAAFDVQPKGKPKGKPKGPTGKAAGLCGHIIGPILVSTLSLSSIKPSSLSPLWAQC